MRVSNITMLIAALVCATAAALLSRAWLKDQAAGERMLATSPQEMRGTQVRSIVVAARELKYGDKLKADMVRLMPWPGDTLPKGAFLTQEPLIQPGQERTVLAAVAENEPLLESKLSGASQGALAAKLADSMNAVTIRVNDVAGVAGFVQADDRVDVFLTVGGKPGDDPAQAGKAAVVVLMQNVRVLATDQTTQRKTQASPPKAVTLEVNTEDAQKLVLAGTIGQLSLALRRADGSADGETRPIALDDLLLNTPQPGASPSGRGGQVIGVTRAVERKEYTVQADGQRPRRAETMR
jgi:pilus assembly protein CpaB